MMTAVWKHSRHQEEPACPDSTASHPRSLYWTSVPTSIRDVCSPVPPSIQTSMLLAELFQHKNTTQAPNVIDVNYSCITLPECVNIDHTAVSNLSIHLTHFIVSGASACTLVKISCGQLKSSDGRYVYPYIPGVFDIAVFHMNGTAIANSGGDKPMEFDKNEVVTMNNSSLTLYKCQSLKMNLIYSDATQKAGTESNGEEPSVKERCSHYIVTEMKNEVVTTAPLNSTIIPDGDNPDTNRGDTSLTWKIIVGIVVPLMLVIAGLLFFCVYKPWRDKQRNQGHRDVEEVQGNPDPNFIPLMQNERRDSRTKDLMTWSPELENCNKRWTFV